MGDRVVDCARLESVCARKAPGVRIPPHPLPHGVVRTSADLKQNLRRLFKIENWQQEFMQ